MDQLEKSKSKIFFYYGLGIGAVVIVLLVLTAFSYRALRQSNADRTTLTIVKMFGLPAGFVNGGRVLYSDFAEDVPAVKNFYESRLAKNPGAVSPSDEEIRKSVWDRLVKNAIVKKLAAKQSLRVSDKEVDDEYGRFAESAGSAEKAEETIKDSYGWTPEQFKQKIIRPFLLQDKLMNATSTVAVLYEAAKSKAGGVLTKAKAGEQSFEDLAKEFGEDATKDKGGDLGWFGKGAMIPEFEDAVAKLEPGQISDLVKTQFGYHVVKLLEKKTEKGEQKWHASHILIRSVPFDQYLDALVKKASVWQWIKI